LIYKVTFYIDFFLLFSIDINVMIDRGINISSSQRTYENTLTLAATLPLKDHLRIVRWKLAVFLFSLLERYSFADHGILYTPVPEDLNVFATIYHSSKDIIRLDVRRFPAMK